MIFPMINRLPVMGSTLARRSWAMSKKSPHYLHPTAITASWLPNNYHNDYHTTKRTMVLDDSEEDLLWWREHSQSLKQVKVNNRPGSQFCLTKVEQTAVVDLFFKYATPHDELDPNATGGEARQPELNLEGVHALLEGIGEIHDDETVRQIFSEADLDDSGSIDLQEFLIAADNILGNAPARIVLIVGGPGSGKGMLSKRLEKEAGLVHLSSGDLLRSEVARGTVLGKQVEEIMAKGELVSSEIIVTLMRRRMRDHPGKRVLLDGFPRSLENAHDLVRLCGKPELALHLECDDTILMERIMARGAASKGERADDNFHTALQRVRTYHKYHNSTIQFLREQHVPIVELDCGVPSDLVWEQLMAIGRMMRPAVKLPKDVKTDADDSDVDLPKTATF